MLPSNALDNEFGFRSLTILLIPPPPPQPPPPPDIMELPQPEPPPPFKLIMVEKICERSGSIGIIPPIMPPPPPLQPPPPPPPHEDSILETPEKRVEISEISSPKFITDELRNSSKNFSSYFKVNLFRNSLRLIKKVPFINKNSIIGLIRLVHRIFDN